MATLTSSVSKGCFVIRPQKSSNSRKRKSTVKLYQDFPLVAGESDKHRRVRYETFTKTWNKVETQVKSLQTNLNDEVFGNLLEFIKKSVSNNKVQKSDQLKLTTPMQMS